MRSGQKLLRKKSADGEKKGGGWFSGFWGKKETKKKEDEEELSVPESRFELCYTSCQVKQCFFLDSLHTHFYVHENSG